MELPLLFLIAFYLLWVLFFLFFDSAFKNIDIHLDNSIQLPTDVLMVENMIWVFIFSTIASFLISGLIVRLANHHQLLATDRFIGKVQAFHLTPTPRIAGIAIFIAALSGSVLWSSLDETQLYKNLCFISLIIASIPAFCGGLIEDIYHNLSAAQRLLLTMISTAIAACIIDQGFTLYHVDVTWIDKLLSIEVILILFTSFAVVGFTNAINIIDGYNGLASGVMVVGLTAITIASFLVNDLMIATTSIIMIGAILGFLLWNWPRGKIFLGDGGSYFIGFISAELCMLFLHRNPAVSPWFPLAIFIYPILETLFTIYRRTFIHKKANTDPDANHLHHLLFKFLLNKNQVKNINYEADTAQFINTCPSTLLKVNNRVAPWIWVATAINSVLAMIFMDSTIVLMGLSLASCLIYILSYNLMKTNKFDAFT